MNFNQLIVILVILSSIKNIDCKINFNNNFINKNNNDEKINNNNNENDDKCEIEIQTHGACMINNNLIKPKITLNFPTTKYQSPMEKHRQVIQEKLKNKQSIVKKTTTNKYKQRIIYEFTNQLIKYMKLDYNDQLNPLIIDNVQNIELNNYGTANVYELKLYGLDNIVPIVNTVEMLDSLESSIWSFNITFYSNNITADFFVDINMNDKIYIKKWNLLINIEQCKFLAGFILNFFEQKLYTNLFMIKKFGNFRLISEQLTWPFNEIVTNIVQKEKYFIRNIIEFYSQKYLNMTLNNNYDMNTILEKIFNDDDNDNDNLQ